MTVIKTPRVTKWNLEDGYSYEKNFSEKNVYPRRMFGVGYRYMMELEMMISHNEPQKLCTDRAQGLRLSLHSPDELPRSSDDFIYVPEGQDIYIAVKPNVITTVDDLRNYPIKERGCFYRSERNLRFYKSYSQRKCELECFANFTKTECGCVRFLMPGK